MNDNREDRELSYAEQIKGKTGLQRIINACGYSIDGFKAAMTEQGFRQLVYLNSVLLVLCFVFPFGPATRMMLIMASFITLIVELFNTGVEAAVDHTSLEKHILAKRAKDVCSAAQTVALMLLAILWLMALWREYGLNVF
ncbi:MAG: diacylglycerol kinase [Neisseria sp.]|uniref:diacylglycerol kinase n=1 Tax=Neisseria sp. TaxID=192066 RepID=UPI0026DC5128|nr:diacylglycerol kinase [Neisseria sp.]MDO4248165.1 diacylglycerol kinase [Neisseria sp.]